MVTRRRWAVAQRYERGYWGERAEKIAEGAVPPLNWYEWRADRLRSTLASVEPTPVARGSARILEVGSGPIGVISFLEGSVRVGVDPLESFFRKRDALTLHRDPRVHYVPGIGEALPFPDASFDLVISENCIDHVRDVDQVLREMARVLTPSGLLYLSVNARTAWGARLHRIVSRLRIDRGHPHTFTRSGFRRLLHAHGLEVRHFRARASREAPRSGLSAASIRSKLKELLGLSESVVSAVAELEAASSRDRGASSPRTSPVGETGDAVVASAAKRDM